MLRFAITQGGYTVEQKLDGPVCPVGEWVHVALTLVGNTGTLYVNGAAAGSGAITLDPSALAPTLNYLGKSQFAADPYFNGAIDDFRIYNRGLNAAEVKALSVPPPAVVIPENSYLAWSYGISFPAGQSAATADTDRDGTLNLLEWLLGSDPLVAGTTGLPLAETRTAAQLGGATQAGKHYLCLSARVRKLRPGVTLIPEAASTMDGLLLPAAASAVTQANAPVADGEYEIHTWYFPVPTEQAPKAFMRLRVVME